MVDSTQYAKTVSYDEITGCFTDVRTSRGFPLGGVGTGGFSIFTDGGFGKFRTNHNWFQIFGALDFPKGTFMAIRAKTATSCISRILRRTYGGGEEYQNITAIAHTKFTGKIPHFHLEYEDKALPIQISLRGFTPLIPQNLKDSSLPVGCFSMTIENPMDQQIEIAVLISFENILGLGGSGGSRILLRDGPVRYNSTKGNFCEKISWDLSDPKQNETRFPNITGLRFRTKQDYALNNPRRRVIGEYFLYLESTEENGIFLSYNTEWCPLEKSPQILHDFHESGTISLSYPPSNHENKSAGAISIRFLLNPKEVRLIPFYILWWTPYYVLEKQQRIRKLTGIHKGIDFGHYYLNFFSNPQEMITYIVHNRERMAKESEELEILLTLSTLPTWLHTYILNAADAILVNTCLSKDGKYYMIEGCPWDWPFGGLTGTIDQRLVSHPYSSLFLTEFDTSELITFRDLTKDGDIPHGNGHCDVMLNSFDVPYGKPIKLYNKTRTWTDLAQSFILQLGRYALITGDINIIRDSWNKMVEMMEFLESSCIDGIPNGITTYDYAFYRPHFIYSARLQIATLQMMQLLITYLIHNTSQLNNSIEKRQSLQSMHLKFQQCIDRCQNTMESKLWNKLGFYRTTSLKNTIFTSALAGDWIVRYIGLENVFSPQKAHSHAIWQKKLLVDSHVAIIRKKKVTRPLVWRESDLNGHEIPVKDNMFIYEFQVNNPYQSLAFMGMEWIYLGETDAGLAVIKRIWEKGYYEGYPWDMDHWGNPGHIYMSHPVMWAIFNVLSGISIDLLAQSMTFSPRQIAQMPILEIPVFFPYFWLWIKYNFQSKQAEMKVIRTFPQYLKEKFAIKTVICILTSEKRRSLSLDKNFDLELGNLLEFTFPVE